MQPAGIKGKHNNYSLLFRHADNSSRALQDWTELRVQNESDEGRHTVIEYA